MGDQPVARLLLPTQTQNKRIQASMHRVGFESTIPLFEPAKTVLEYRTMDEVQKSSDFECYTPSSEHFRIYKIQIFLNMLIFNDCMKRIQQMECITGRSSKSPMKVTLLQAH
jgi:hypothetical protein